MDYNIIPSRGDGVIAPIDGAMTSPPFNFPASKDNDYMISENYLIVSGEDIHLCQ